MHCAILTPKCHSATVTVLLGLFAVYGGIGNILYILELFRFPEKGDWPFNQRFTIFMIMAVNSCYILAAALGLFAFISQRFHIFFWSSFILMGTFAIQLIHGVACFRASLEPMDGSIFSSFRSFQNDPTFTSWLLDFQWQYDCCGIKSYMDWQLFKTSFLNDYSVPDSCCNRKERIPSPKCGEGLIAPNVSVETASKTINTLGCGNKISAQYQDQIRVKGILMLLIAFISLCAGTTIFIIHQKIEAKQYGEARRRNIRTDAQRLQRIQRPNALGNAGSSSSNNNQQQMDINGNTPKVPSYYKVNVAHKPPTGRVKPPRQDSTRNFHTRNMTMQKNSPKYRVNPHQKHKYNPNVYNSNNRAFGKSRRGSNNDLLKTKLEMLMHPIETYSTSSATPNSSDLFPFYTAHPSTSACIQPSENFDQRTRTSSTNRTGHGHGHKNNTNLDLKLAHYNSLPQVVTFPDGRVETLYHYNTSHVHAPNLRRKYSQRPPPNFGVGVGASGKSKFPSLTITSTLATIHEENESVKSGNSQASSTCTTNASSSPKSLSKSSSKQNQIQSSPCNGIDSEAVLNELQRTAEEQDIVLKLSKMEENSGNNDNDKDKDIEKLQHQTPNLNHADSIDIDQSLPTSDTCTGQECGSRTSLHELSSTIGLASNNNNTAANTGNRQTIENNYSGQLHSSQSQRLPDMTNETSPRPNEQQLQEPQKV